VGALFGRAGQGPEMGPRRVSRLAKRTGVGEGSPGSRKAEGKGGEGFYIAQSGRRPDLLCIFPREKHLLSLRD
jgi:hypothetical protein